MDGSMNQEAGAPLGGGGVLEEHRAEAEKCTGKIRKLVAAIAALHADVRLLAVMDVAPWWEEHGAIKTLEHDLANWRQRESAHLRAVELFKKSDPTMELANISVILERCGNGGYSAVVAGPPRLGSY